VSRATVSVVNGEGRDSTRDDVLTVAVQRSDALAAFGDGPIRRADLEDAVSVSRTTAHRIIHALEEHGLIAPTPDGYERTPLGDAVADAVRDADDAIRGALSVEPLLRAIRETPFEVDAALFADATVTTPEPGDPYAPVRRFADLVEGASRLRGFDTTTLAPTYVDALRERILGGMETSVVYLPAVAERMADSYPDTVAAAVASGHLHLFVRDSLPFALALVDGRVGLGAYDDDTGMLARFVDTDDADAVAWGERLYEHYRADATPYDPTS